MLELDTPIETFTVQCIMCARKAQKKRLSMRTRRSGFIRTIILRRKRIKVYEILKDCLLLISASL